MEQNKKQMICGTENYSVPAIQFEQLYMQSFICISGDTTEQYVEGFTYEEEDY